MAKKKLCQIIDSPTCIAAQQTLIDLIMTDSDCIKYPGVLDINMSDHLPVFLLRKKIKVKTPKCEFSGRTYRNYNKETLANRLQQYSWDNCYCLDDVNECWSVILDRVNHFLYEICPIKMFSFNKEKQPWVNQELMANRDDSIINAKRTGSPDDIIYARKLRNKTKNSINKAKTD